MMGTTQHGDAFVENRQPLKGAALREARPAAFPSEQIAAALRHLESNVQRGKIVVAT